MLPAARSRSRRAAATRRRSWRTSRFRLQLAQVVERPVVAHERVANPFDATMPRRLAPTRATHRFERLHNRFDVAFPEKSRNVADLAPTRRAFETAGVGHRGLEIRPHGNARRAPSRPTPRGTPRAPAARAIRACAATSTFGFRRRRSRGHAFPTAWKLGVVLRQRLAVGDRGLNRSRGENGSAHERVSRTGGPNFVRKSGLERRYHGHPLAQSAMRGPRRNGHGRSRNGKARRRPRLRESQAIGSIPKNAPCRPAERLKRGSMRNRIRSDRPPMRRR